MLHPEVHEGRLLWIDRDIVAKIQGGDPVLGWEGDDRLAVYLEAETPDGPVWALWRLEEDNVYRHVVRTEPGVPFDERVIHWLIAHDKRRKGPDFNLDEIVKKHNDQIDAKIEADRNEYIAEELAPRLRHALVKDGW